MHPHQHPVHADMQLQPKIPVAAFARLAHLQFQACCAFRVDKGVRKPTMEFMTSLMNGALQCL